MIKRDLHGIAAAAAFIVVGGLAIYYTGDFTPLGTVFPMTIAAIMIVLACAYIAVALLRPEAAPPRAPGSIPRRIALAVTLLAWAYLLDPLGFLTTSIAAYVAVLVIANYDRWTPKMALGYAAVGAVMLGGLYSLFRFVLEVPFPSGVLL